MSTPTIPQDKTPLQRAQLKLISHFAIIAVVAAVLAALAYVDNNSGAAINWSILGTAIASQVALALLDAGKKYFSAQNEPTYATMMELARNEVAARTPKVKYSANEQAIATTASELFAQVDAAPAPSAQVALQPASHGAGVKPEVTADPAPAPQEDAPVNMVNTLPIIAAVNPAQA